MQTKFLKKTTKVWVYETTDVDETIWTFNKFERERETQISEMAWSNASYNFTNYLGEVAQLQLEKGCNKHLENNDGEDYPATEEGFKMMI